MNSVVGVSQFLLGYLRISIKGGSAERFLNICAGRGIRLWNLERTEGNLCLNLSLSAFYRLHPIIRKTKVKVVILEKNGLPFLLNRFQKRWVFFLGALLAVSAWLISTRFLWSMEFSGNMKITSDQLERFLEKRGVCLMVPLGSIRVTELELALYDEFEDVTWNSIRIQGTALIVDLKERDVPQNQTEIQSHLGMNLISSDDGVITEMIVRKGVPKVKLGDEIKKDQVLVEGRVPVMNEDGTVREWILTEPDADVWVERKLQYEGCESLYYLETVPGRRKEDEYRFFFYGNEYFTGEKNVFYRESVLETEVTPKLIQMLGMPIRIRKITHGEVKVTLRKRNEDEAKEQSLTKLLKFLTTLEEKGVQIIEKDVKISIEGDFSLTYGEIMIREKEDLFQKTEDELDGTQRGLE